MGMEFLDHFQLLTLNSHRLVPGTSHLEPTPRLLSAGTKCPQISLMLDGIQVVARADTGSELDLIEDHFAKRCGFRTHRLEEDDPQELELLDGRRVPLVGKILLKVGIHEKDLVSFDTTNQSATQHDEEEWNNAQRTTSSGSIDLPQERLFHISTGLSSAVVAGQELLHSMDAFRRCLLSGESEDCATPIFKVRNEYTGAQSSPGKWSLSSRLLFMH